jgi:hypothetical protein
MSDDQDHHYVPQFLLRQWCTQDGCLTVYRRPRDQVVTSRRNPKGTGYETNLYSLDQVPSAGKHVIEKNFMTPGIDTPASLVAAKILAGGFEKLSSDERSDFSRFILSLRARHPDAVALVKEVGHKALITELERDPEEYDALREPTSPPTLKEMMDKAFPSLELNFGLSLLPRVIADDPTAERLFRMPWWVHDVRQSNTDLLLSDRPCLLEGNAVDGSCVIALPLSPTMILFICNEEGRISRLQSMSATMLVKTINRASVIYAVTRIYGTGSHHLPLVEKYLGKQSG